MKAPWFLIEKIIFFCDLGPLIFLIFIGLTDIFFQCRYFFQTCSINVSGKNISWLRSPINGGKFLENFLTPWGSPVGGTIRRQVHQKYHFFVYPFFFNGRVLVLMCLDVWCPKTIWIFGKVWQMQSFPISQKIFLNCKYSKSNFGKKFPIFRNWKFIHLQMLNLILMEKSPLFPSPFAV